MRFRFELGAVVLTTNLFITFICFVAVIAQDQVAFGVGLVDCLLFSATVSLTIVGGIMFMGWVNFNRRIRLRFEKQMSKRLRERGFRNAIAEELGIESSTTERVNFTHRMNQFLDSGKSDSTQFDETKSRQPYWEDPGLELVKDLPRSREFFWMILNRIRKLLLQSN